MRVLVTASEKGPGIHPAAEVWFHVCPCWDVMGTRYLKKVANVPILDLKMYRSVKAFNPDLFLGSGSIRAAHVSRIMRKPCINFDDDEYSYPYYHHFADAICGFSGFQDNRAKSH